MKCLVIESHGQQPREAIQHSRLVVRESTEGIDGRDAHTGAQQGHVAAHVRHAVDLEQRVAVVIGERQDAARTMILEAARHVRHTSCRERRRNGVTRIPLAFAAFESEMQHYRAIQPLSCVSVETVHHGVVPAGSWAGTGGNPRRTASAGKVAMTASRVVSRKATNQKPEAIWHHHSYLVPGAPERL